MAWVVYVKRAANLDWRQTRYDQPIDHLSGGADHAIRPGVLSRRGCSRHSAACLALTALVRFTGIDWDTQVRIEACTHRDRDTTGS